MNDIHQEVSVKGYVKGIIDFKSGEQKVIEFPNTILRKGREALAACLANDIGDSYDFYVARMLFGDGGTSGGTTKFVNTNRNGLFGVTRANKGVISQVNPDIPSQVIFTSVITYSEANGATLNEMALQMNNGNLYSMVTFPDLTKTEQMQLTWSWSINVI
jgi:molybdopterin-binding protein